MTARAKGKHKDNVVIGLAVRKHRGAIGMSQTDLADAIKASLQMVQQYETGQASISARRLKDIAKALKTPVSAFFEGFSGIPADDSACGGFIKGQVTAMRDLVSLPAPQRNAVTALLKSMAGRR